MKNHLILALAVLSTSAFAGINCFGTTIIFDEDGMAKSYETPLLKVSGEKNTAVYFGESEIFKFWAERKEDSISLEIHDKKDIVVISHPEMQLARFNVSIGGYWRTYFASLNCSPTQN